MIAMIKILSLQLFEDGDCDGVIYDCDDTDASFIGTPDFY